MDKIYEQAKDLHVVATMIYKKDGDQHAYKDVGCEKAFKTSELKEAFIKGALIKIGDAIHLPTGFMAGSVWYAGETGSYNNLTSIPDEPTE